LQGIDKINQVVSIGKFFFHQKQNLISSIHFAKMLLEIEGVEVDFPYEPYECQVKFMGKVINSLKNVSFSYNWKTSCFSESKCSTGISNGYRKNVGIVVCVSGLCQIVEGKVQADSQYN
jgi:hypothetical protein